VKALLILPTNNWFHVVICKGIIFWLHEVPEFSKLRGLKLQVGAKMILNYMTAWNAHTLEEITCAGGVLAAVHT